MEKTKIGIVGCGKISGIYFKAGKTFEILDIKACADIMPDRAKAAAEANGCQAMTVEQLLADPEIQIVVNLTIPNAHYSVAMAAVAAGKSVHNEKPLTITREEGKKLLAAAKAKGVRVGCAPDTFMGGGLQTCRKLIDDGLIGQPVAATAFMTCRGHESWHPDPEFYYKVGGGPMFDMGPYYLTALVSMMGPIKRVTGSARVTFPERTITSQPKNGTKIKVDVPTHVAGVMDFASGAVGTIITTFDVWGANLPRIEIYGTNGSLSVPDPNGFGGVVKYYPPERKVEWKEMPLTHGYAENSRGIGVADMAYALRSGRAHRASGELAYHVLDVMHAFHDASSQNKHAMLESTTQRPAALPVGLAHGQLDA
ncbi:MAG: Gfo/Idh/MocA family oxidoreductase [Phycisphaerae bacterium]|jgi:predicted dehydrogenase